MPISSTPDFILGTEVGGDCVKGITYKITPHLLAPEVLQAERKHLGEGVPAALVFTCFTKWFGLSRTAARLASDGRLLGCQWHALPLSNPAKRGTAALVSGFVHLGLLLCGL